MRKSVLLRCILLCSGFSLLLACGGDDGGDDDAAAGGGGKAGGGGGTGGSTVVDDTPPNADCPNVTGPFDGPYALKGACCYRTSNSKRLEDDEPAVLEYKSSYFVTANHKDSASLATVAATTVDRFDKDEQQILFRFTIPREGGKFKNGDAMIQIGTGRYNCDGTYSFYGATAAPSTTNFKDPSRWQIRSNPAKFDGSKPAGDQLNAVWATNANQDLSYLAYIKAMPDSSGNKPLDWETVTRGFDIIQWPKLEDSLDCVGSRADSSRWQPAAKTISFAPLDENNKDPIEALQNITLSQLFSFGTTVGAMKDMPKFNVLTATRCMPDEAGPCEWVKLPDSLCPAEADKATWRCHVGYKDNPDKLPTNCTMDAPSGTLDPDKGATSEGQCCDPLGMGKDGLPACNAHSIVSDVVASSVEITDEPANALQQNCQK